VAEAAPVHPLAAGRAKSGEASLRRRWREWVTYRISDPLFGGLYFGIHFAGRFLPIDWCSAIGGLVGVVCWRHRDPAVRERVDRWYRALSRSDVGNGDGDVALRRLSEHLGRVALEFSVLDRLWAAGRIAAIGVEHLLAARHAGRPVIVMGVHVGNWEVIGPTLIGLGLSGFRFIYQPPPSRFDHKIVVGARTRYGAIMLFPGVAAARAAHRLLVAERGVLLIYVDEEHRGQVNAPLLGRQIPARSNLANVVRYAWTSGAAIIPAYVERIEGARFRTIFLPPVGLAPEGEDRSAALVENVHRVDRIITPIVLGHLDQWYMLFEGRS
jgi:KDO2-lipid IV(A) lauroyltransferase